MGKEKNIKRKRNREINDNEKKGKEKGKEIKRNRRK